MCNLTRKHVKVQENTHLYRDLLAKGVGTTAIEARACSIVYEREVAEGGGRKGGWGLMRVGRNTFGMNCIRDSKIVKE